MDDQSPDRQDAGALVGDSRSGAGHCAGHVAGSSDADVAIVTDLPRTLPVLRGEVTLLRAFLGEQIDAVLFSER